MLSDLISTKKKLRELKIFTAVVPGGCTKFVQAPDVSWNSPFKAFIRQYYDTWMSNQDRMEFTTGGNPKPPSMEVYLDWIQRAWDAISKEIITKSFKECGVTNALDDSDDRLIHCFKPHGSIPEGLQMLKDARREDLRAEQMINEADEDEDLANSYISDEDEVDKRADVERDEESMGGSDNEESYETDE